jgi:aminobenzoyl-glutamate utilization protein B
VLADTAQDLFKNPEIIKSANKEYLERVGSDFEYYPLLGDRKPPLDYRN